jgi:LPS export ABC transporter protein LptC
LRKSAGLFALIPGLFFSACGLHANPSAASAPRQTMQGFWLSQSLLADRLWTLEADNAVLNENSTADLSEPHLTFYKNRKVSTIVTSVYGLVHMDSQDIELSTTVVATSKEDQTVLKTEKLFYSSSRKKIYTDLPVVLTKPNGVLHGRGLEANPDLSDIRIFNQKTDLSKTPEND